MFFFLAEMMLHPLALGLYKNTISHIKPTIPVCNFTQKEEGGAIS